MHWTDSGKSPLASTSDIISNLDSIGSTLASLSNFVLPLEWETKFHSQKTSNGETGDNIKMDVTEIVTMGVDVQWSALAITTMNLQVLLP
jgi:hypothetical protein